MPAVFVGLVHLHDSVFIKERLLFFGELVRFTGTERYGEGGTYQQQSERSFVHGEISGAEGDFFHIILKSRSHDLLERRHERFHLGLLADR